MNREIFMKASAMIFIALVCGITLAIANQVSQPNIQKQQQKYEQDQLLEVVGRHDYEIVRMQPASKTRYRLEKEKRLAGFLDQVTTQEGYNGEIRFWIATEISQKKRSGFNVLGVRVIEHRETPGLGDKLDLAVSDWVLGFNDKNLYSTNWDVKKYGGDFDQFSGATITPRAIVRRIKQHLELLEREQRLSSTLPTGDGR